jgi:hypothetical protein
MKEHKIKKMADNEISNNFVKADEIKLGVETFAYVKAYFHRLLVFFTVLCLTLEILNANDCKVRKHINNCMFSSLIMIIASEITS